MKRKFRVNKKTSETILALSALVGTIAVIIFLINNGAVLNITSAVPTTLIQALPAIFVIMFGIYMLAQTNLKLFAVPAFGTIAVGFAYLISVLYDADVVFAELPYSLAELQIITIVVGLILGAIVSLQQQN